MKGYHGNIEKLTEENKFFRQVLYTAKHSQLVVMSLKPFEEIGLETHPENDQFFQDAIIVPAGAKLSSPPPRQSATSNQRPSRC